MIALCALCLSLSIPIVVLRLPPPPPLFLLLNKRFLLRSPQYHGVLVVSTFTLNFGTCVRERGYYRTRGAKYSFLLDTMDTVVLIVSKSSALEVYGGTAYHINSLPTAAVVVSNVSKSRRRRAIRFSPYLHPHLALSAPDPNP